jgi:acetyl-CoA acetyltransferase
MSEAFLCDGERVEAPRPGPGLPPMEAAELAARAVRTLVERHPGVEWAALDDLVVVVRGGGAEDVARSAALRAVLPRRAGAVAVQRGDGSGLDAVSIGARAIKAGEAELVVAAIVSAGAGAAGLERAGQAPATACALLLASDRAAPRHGLTPLVRVVATTVAGSEPGSPRSATAGAVERLLERAGIWTQDVAVFEIDDVPGARDGDGAHLVLGAARELARRRGRYAVSATAVGPNQAIATLLERASP